MTDSTRPGGQLAGVRVVDLTRVLAGPFCTMILADLGAEVLKIEEPELGDQARHLPPHVDGQSHYFVAVNRNKRSVALDLKSSEGRAVARDLVARADVVVENFRPGVLDRLGLGYEQLRELRENIILCSISGFGNDSPLRDEPSFDLIVQALSGVMSINGEPDGPPTRLGLPMGDLGGGLWGAIAILAALQHRASTGTGQHLDISLVDGLMGLLGYHAGLALAGEDAVVRIPSSGHQSVVPYGCYPAKDGYLTVAVYGDQFWEGFCRAVDQPEWAHDPRFKTVTARRVHRAALEPELERVLRTRTRAEWRRAFTAENVPNAPVLSVREALEQDHASARGIVADVGRDAPAPVVGNPIRSTIGPAAAPSSPPRLGEDTAAVLRRVLGYDDARIDALAASGAIGTA